MVMASVEIIFIFTMIIAKNKLKNSSRDKTIVWPHL